jgi:hypothetical protein
MAVLKQVKYVLIGACIVAGLSACVPHLTEQQCKTTNWYSMGYNDGSHGQLQRDLSRDITDCAKFKIDVNTKAYTRGWSAGVRLFCRPRNGYQLGVDGQNYHHICPASMAGAFERQWRRGLRKYCIPSTGYNLGRSGKAFPNFCSPNQVVRFRNAYDSGYRIYQSIRTIQSEIDNTNSQLIDVAYRIRHRKRDISHWSRDLSHAKGKQRKQLRENIRQANRQISDLNRRMNNLNHHRDMLQVQLNRQNARG